MKPLDTEKTSLCLVEPYSVSAIPYDGHSNNPTHTNLPKQQFSPLVYISNNLFQWMISLMHYILVGFSMIVGGFIMSYGPDLFTYFFLEDSEYLKKIERNMSTTNVIIFESAISSLALGSMVALLIIAASVGKRLMCRCHANRFDRKDFFNSFKIIVLAPLATFVMSSSFTLIYWSSRILAEQYAPPESYYFSVVLLFLIELLLLYFLGNLIWTVFLRIAGDLFDGSRLEKSDNDQVNEALLATCPVGAFEVHCTDDGTPATVFTAPGHSFI